MTKKRSAAELPVPNSKRQQDVSSFFKKYENKAAFETTSASSHDANRTPEAGQHLMSGSEGSSGEGFLPGAEFPTDAGSDGKPANADAGTTGKLAEAGDGDSDVADTILGFHVGPAEADAGAEAHAGSSGEPPEKPTDSISAGQPDPPADRISSYCDSIGKNNFAKLSADNLQKLEQQFKAQTELLAKHVETLSQNAMSPLDHKKMLAMEAASKASTVDPRSTLGGQFRAALKADKAEAVQYAGMSRDDAAQFRLDWLKKEYNKFHEERLYSKAWKRVDTTKGKYMSASQLVLDDGGWSDEFAVDGAQKLIEKAIAMGEPWVRIHPQTGRTLFLKLNFEFEELFEESWSTFRRELNDGNLAITDSAAAVKPVVGDAAVDTGAGDDSSTGGGMPSPKPKPATKPKPAPKPKLDQDKVFDDMWRQALLNRKLMMSVVAAAREIDDQITSSAAWSWAKNSQNQGKLNDLSMTLRADMTEFHRGFLAEEPGTIRKRHAKEMVMVELTAFNKMRDKMSAVGEFVKTMQRRHLS
jgi:hypothetical protein